jgi:hypothetical protein
MGATLPTVDLGAKRSVKAIAVGFHHTCALLDTAQVKCWGINSGGTLGLGDTTNRGNSPGEMGNALPELRLTGPDGTAPAAPTHVVATPGNHAAAVVWDYPPSDGGLPIPAYTVTASPGGRTATGAWHPLMVTGLTDGVSYTFTVQATNAAGTSPSSIRSAPVVIRSQPDVWAKARASLFYSDIDAYSTVATVSAAATAQSAARFDLRLQNDGTFKEAITLKLTVAGYRGFALTEYDGPIPLGTGPPTNRTFNINPGATLSISVVVSATAGSTRGQVATVTCTATSSADPTKQDQVRLRAIRADA